MDRDIVYGAIDSERDFQDAFTRDKGLNPNKTVGEFLTLLRTYGIKADLAWTGSTGDAGAIEEIRKIAAICVACMEKHGVNYRSPYTSRTPAFASVSHAPARIGGMQPRVNGLWQNVVSSNIQAVRYNKAEEILHIRFRDGGIYEFIDVPSNIYLGFMTSPSKGKYFHANIRGVFQSTRIK